MLTKRSTPRAADKQPPDGWDKIRFWVGIFGMFVTASVLCLGPERAQMILATRRSP